jgi:hypothetical protein
MDTGHPYLTEELDQLRSEQRRDLRVIPKNLLPRISPPLEPVSLHDRPILELALRRFAQQELPAIQTYLDAAARHLEASLVVDAVNRWPQWSDPTRGLAEMRDRFLEQRAVSEEEVDQAGAAVMHPLRSVAFMLVWAEALADDDYEDPRLRAAAAG